MSFRPHRWLLLALAALWLPVIYLLGAQWSIYEEYAYGWAVPFLCVFFAFRRTRSTGEDTALADVRPWANDLERCRCSRFRRFSILGAFILALLMLLPFRILQEANPLWRLASYLLVADAALVTLLLLALTHGASLAFRFKFPVLFFFVAVPWPTPVEGFIVRHLTGINTAAVLEILHAFNVPAFARGNVIDLAAGSVGIEEACSGIRSLQAVLMLSLAFGEWFRQSLRSRVLLVCSAIGIALSLNIIRTVTLSAFTAHGGPAMAHRWHDTTGILLLLVSFTLVWAIAARLFRSSRGAPVEAPVSGRAPVPREAVDMAKASLLVPSILVLVFSGLSVLGSEVWFRVHEQNNPSGETLAITLPAQQPQFRELPQSDEVKRKLQYDSAETGAWRGLEGTWWQFFHFRWNVATSLKDRVRVQLAKSHRPEICLPASGWTLQEEFSPIVVPAAGLPLIFRAYEFKSGPRSTFVFFCVREDNTARGLSGNMRETHASRWRAAWAGNRGLGQRVIEIALTGPATLAEAEQLLRSELPRLIKPQ